MRNKGTFVAVVVSVALHAGALGAMMMNWTHPEPPAKDEGVAGIEVAMGPSGTQGAEELPPAETPTVAPEEAEVVSEVVPQQVAEVTPVETKVKPEEVTPVAPPEAVRPEDATEVKTKAPVDAVHAQPVKPPPPPPPPKKVVRREQEKRPKPEKPAEPSPAQTIGAETTGGTQSAQAPQPSNAVGNQTASRGGGAPGRASYASVIQSWIQQHHRYPQRALALGYEGAVLVNFSLDADGRLLSARVVRSSGREMLDDAALETMRRADPFPAPPPEHVAQFRGGISIQLTFDLKEEARRRRR